MYVDGGLKPPGVFRASSQILKPIWNSSESLTYCLFSFIPDSRFVIKTPRRYLKKKRQQPEAFPALTLPWRSGSWDPETWSTEVPLPLSILPTSPVCLLLACLTPEGSLGRHILPSSVVPFVASSSAVLAGSIAALRALGSGLCAPFGAIPLPFPQASGSWPPALPGMLWALLVLGVLLGPREYVLC